MSYDPEEVIMAIGEYIDKHKVSRLIPFFPLSPDGSVRADDQFVVARERDGGGLPRLGKASSVEGGDEIARTESSARIPPRSATGLPPLLHEAAGSSQLTKSGAIDYLTVRETH